MKKRMFLCFVILSVTSWALTSTVFTSGAMAQTGRGQHRGVELSPSHEAVVGEIDTPVEGGLRRRPIDPARIAAALAGFRHEPSVQAVVHQGLRHAGLAPARVEDLVFRARLSGLLPMARIGLRRGQAIDLRGRSFDALEASNISTDDDLVLEASLVFRLDRLVFAPQEVALARQAHALSERRRDLVQSLIHLYFERRRLLLERRLIGPQSLDHALRVLQTEALLESLTGGFFRSAELHPDRTRPRGGQRRPIVAHGAPAPLQSMR